jgi:hypothetical protein
MNQGVSDKSKAKQAPDDFEIAKEYESRRKVTLSQPAGKREYTGKGQQAKRPLITGKVSADLWRTNHNAPKSFTPTCSRRKRGCWWIQHVGCLHGSANEKACKPLKRG